MKPSTELVIPASTLPIGSLLWQSSRRRRRDVSGRRPGTGRNHRPALTAAWADGAETFTPAAPPLLPRRPWTWPADDRGRPGVGTHASGPPMNASPGLAPSRDAAALGGVSGAALLT